MPNETVKRAAQEYLAERLSEEGLTYEQTLNRDAAVVLERCGKKSPKL